jgi:phosphatidylglycerol:prolipoprotein diacylglycerol transferase
MYPVLFRVGEFSVHAYGVLLALAFAVGILGLARAARRAGLPEEKLFDMSLYITVAAIIGSRLLYVLIKWPYFVADPLSVFAVRSGGLSFHGGLAAGVLTGLWYTHRHKLPQGKIADLVAPFVAFGYGIVRIGCLLNGCCFGRRAAVPWALPAAYLDPTLRHPTQLYASAAAFLIFLLLLYRRQRVRFHGQLFLEFIVYYSIYRFLVEFFRETDVFVGALTLGQASSLLVAVACAVAIRIWPLRKRA